MKMDAAAWNLMFLVVYVVAVAVDPLFFYLPVINEKWNATITKCITTDKTLEIIAICVRSFLDLVAIGDLVRPRSKRYCLEASEYVIHILGILPVPQVLVPIIVSGMSGSKFRKIRKFLNAVVILQYVPRILRVWRLWNKAVNDSMSKQPKTESSRTTEEDNEKEKKKEKKMKKEKKKYMVLKAGLNLYLYLIASHVLGAFWYFFSIERETKCWQKACESDNICNKTTTPRSFHCDDDFRINYPIINDYCSLKIPNTNLSDFGIFQKARQSGILDSMDFPRKTLFCFWWGLRNLSSLGQNLETSTDYWENCFTILISIFGLLLFLYFIGNLQVYMQSEASEWLERYKQRSYDGIQAA